MRPSNADACRGPLLAVPQGPILVRHRQAGGRTKNGLCGGLVLRGLVILAESYVTETMAKCKVLTDLPGVCCVPS